MGKVDDWPHQRVYPGQRDPVEYLESGCRGKNGEFDDTYSVHSLKLTCFTSSILKFIKILPPESKQ